MTTPEFAAAPIRTCVGCRQRRPQPQLVRCVIGADGPTVSRTAPGRGAWVCSADCLRTAITRKGFDRAWRRQVPTESLQALQNAFERVITNMEELPAGGFPLTGDRPLKG